ncbi:hypothetical protein CFIO01_00716 [Colletotrichum fioriniae PJ7]|uniref:Uncharacterized protein n=1 Tax=Colletotrichum fioriniae PJ7 TaxID=1445577 RepID=A0A010RZ90_9PEZI|nr:hypothetical protein CFIO01_00716 [Colletotrichum fioriniae PJ7]
MSDPFSIAGSIAGIVQLSASVFQQVSKFVKDAKGAEKANDEAFNILEKYYEGLKPGSGLHAEPEPKELIDLISTIISAFEKVFIVIDGVDECGDNMTEVSEAVRLLFESLQPPVSRFSVEMNKTFGRQLLEKQLRMTSPSSKFQLIRKTLKLASMLKWPREGNCVISAFRILCSPRRSDIGSSTEPKECFDGYHVSWTTCVI